MNGEQVKPNDIDEQAAWSLLVGDLGNIDAHGLCNAGAVVHVSKIQVANGANLDVLAFDLGNGSGDVGNQAMFFSGGKHMAIQVSSLRVVVTRAADLEVASDVYRFEVVGALVEVRVGRRAVERVGPVIGTWALVLEGDAAAMVIIQASKVRAVDGY